MIATEIPPLEQLWAENAILQAKLIEQDVKLVEKDQHISHLEEQLTWFKRQIFGKRLERVVGHLNQQQLMLEGFENPEASKEEEKETVATHTRSKSNRNGQDKITLPPRSARGNDRFRYSRSTKSCPETGEALTQIGVEITHKLAHQPGSYYIKEIICPKYAHPKKEEAGILTVDAYKFSRS